jgi:hypothetical protein
MFLVVIKSTDETLLCVENMERIESSLHSVRLCTCSVCAHLPENAWNTASASKKTHRLAVTNGVY